MAGFPGGHGAGGGSGVGATGAAGATGAVGGAGAGTRSDDQGVMHQVKDAAGDAVDEAQDKLGQAADKAKQQVTRRLSGQIDVASEGLGSVAEAVLAVGRQLREQDKGQLAGYADRTAEQVQSLAGYLRGKDLDDIVEDTEDFARRQPAVFLGGALALGLLASRFLKSTGRRAEARAAARRPALPPPPRYGPSGPYRGYGGYGAPTYAGARTGASGTAGTAGAYRPVSPRPTTYPAPASGPSTGVPPPRPPISPDLGSTGSTGSAGSAGSTGTAGSASGTSGRTGTSGTTGLSGATGGQSGTGSSAP